MQNNNNNSHTQRTATAFENRSHRKGIYTRHASTVSNIIGKGWIYSTRSCGHPQLDSIHAYWGTLQDMAIAKSTGKWQTERIGTRGKWHHKSTINWSGHGVVSEDWRQRSDHKPVGNKSRPILIDTPNWDEYNKGTIKTESKNRCTEYTRWKWAEEDEEDEECVLLERILCMACW